VSVDHYENFPVASVLCPPALRAPIKAIYHFARTADDLADEGDAPALQRIADLHAYRDELRAVAAGAAPGVRWAGVFAPLQQTLRTRVLPLPLLTDLLDAFEQDVTKQRYADRAEVLDYCRRSANPVGRLLLHLYGIDDAAALRQSDAVCTALQLTNFWLDLGVDARRGRLYVPATDLARHGVAPATLLAGQDGANVRGLVADLVGWARALMREGAPLVHRLPGRAGWELRLVVQGGLRILERIEAIGHATLIQRPVLSVTDVPRLLWRAWRMSKREAAMASSTA
jgi:squalene synthase HpnC